MFFGMHGPSEFKQLNFTGYNVHSLFLAHIDIHTVDTSTLIQTYPQPSQLGFQALARRMETAKSVSKDDSRTGQALRLRFIPKRFCFID